MTDARPRVLLTRRWPEGVERTLRQRYDVDVDAADRPLDTAALRDAMLRYDAICPTVSDRIGADVLGVSDARVRIVANYGVGYDHVDLAAARAAGIVVTNTPGVLTEATADLAILLMLMAGRRAGEGERELRSGAWSGWRPTHLVGRGMAGKTLGIVGFGRIGRAVAERARAFGLAIAYTARRRADPAVEAALGARWCEDVETLAAMADIVSLHCPGGPETRHLIDARLLAMMKCDAILVNTARGSVVDEAALAAALADGTIAGAGLDVYADEPQVHPALLAAPNAVLLPHLGSATIETRSAMGARVIANLNAFFAGQAPPDRVA